MSVSDEASKMFQEFKLSNKIKYVIFKMDKDYTQVVLEKVKETKGTTYEDFSNEFKNFPPQECRFAVCHFDWETENSGKRSKICFFTWCPETAKLKEKMVYTSSHAFLKNHFDGVAFKIQANDLSDVDYEKVLEKVSKGPGNK